MIFLAIFAVVILVISISMYFYAYNMVLGLVLVPGYESEFQQATNETGLSFLLVEHEDLSISLYGWDNKTTTLGPDNLPNKMTYLAGFTNELALPGPNGVADILNKIPSWNLTD